MKRYDRKTKKYVTQEEYDRSHATKDKDLCRGKKPHDFVLVLPDWVTYVQGVYKFDARVYYDLMEKKRLFNDSISALLAQAGIASRYGTSDFADRKETRHYVCTVCSKRKWEYGK